MYWQPQEKKIIALRQKQSLLIITMTRFGFQGEINQRIKTSKIELFYARSLINHGKNLSVNSLDFEVTDLHLSACTRVHFWWGGYDIVGSPLSHLRVSGSMS